MIKTLPKNLRLFLILLIIVALVMGAILLKNSESSIKNTTNTPVAPKVENSDTSGGTIKAQDFKPQIPEKRVILRHYEGEPDHLECYQNACAIILGEGQNTCQKDSDCL